MSRLFNAVRELSGSDANISIPRVYIAFCNGDLQQAAVLNQLVFWSGRSKRADGWFYKRHEDLADELCFSVDQVRYALKKLKSRLGECLQTARKKADGVPTVHYKFDEVGLVNAIFPDNVSDSVNLPNGNGNPTESIREDSRILGSGNFTESTNRSDTDPIKQISNPIVPCESSNEKPQTAKRKTTLPENFTVTESMRDWYTQQNFSLCIEDATAQWCDAMLAKQTKYVDWPAAWRNGMRNANKWAAQRSGGAPARNINQVPDRSSDFSAPAKYRKGGDV